MASLLDNHVPKVDVKEVANHLFGPDLLVGLGKVLMYAVHGIGLPRPGDLASIIDLEESITFYPFLLDLKGPALMKHRAIVAVAHAFLKWKFRTDYVEDMDEEEEFRDFAILNGFLIPKEEDETPILNGNTSVHLQRGQGRGRARGRGREHGCGRRGHGGRGSAQSSSHPGSST